MAVLRGDRLPPLGPLVDGQHPRRLVTRVVRQLGPEAALRGFQRHLVTARLGRAVGPLGIGLGPQSVEERLVVSGQVQVVLAVEARIDQHHAGDLLGKALVVVRRIAAADRVPDQHERLAHSGLEQQGVQVVSDVARRAGLVRSRALAIARPVIEAGAVGLAELGLDVLPVEDRPTQGVLEDQGRRALTDADHVQLSAAADVDQALVQHLRAAARRHRRRLRRRQDGPQTHQRQNTHPKTAHHPSCLSSGSTSGGVAAIL